MRGKLWQRTLLALMLIGFAGSAQAALTLTSSVSQSGDYLWTNSPIDITASGGWNFTGQAYNDLASIDKISITLTLYEADTKPGEFDYNQLTLGLDGYNTGLKLNGFGSNQTNTLTLTTTSPLNTSDILASLQADGRLMGTLLDATTGNNYLGVVGSACTTLSITGDQLSTVPAPGAVLLCGLGATCAGWFKKRKVI